MAKDKEKEEKPAAEAIPLTDAERLQILEGNNKLNRILIIVMLALVGFALPIVLTIALVGGGEDDSEATAAFAQQIEALQAQNKALEEQLTELAKLQVKQAEQLTLVQETALTQSVQAVQGSAPAKPAGPDMKTIAQVSKTLMEQERDLQQLLQNQQTSMRDLANMVPGSRSWLEDYNESLNKLMASSRGRVVELQRWVKEAAKR